jgi:SPP1 family predicted phage head-tail adaptor
MLQTRINIGRLDRRIVIQELTNTSDEYNQPVSSWATFTTVWAEVKDGGVSEGFQADQLTATRMTTFVTRYMTGLTELMRILYGGKVYNIRGIRSPDRKRSLEIVAEMLDDPTESAVVEGIFDETFDFTFE